MGFSFQNRHYKVRLSVVMHHSFLDLVISALDTGVDQTLLDQLFLCPSWRKQIRPDIKLYLESVSKQSIHMKGIIKLVVLLDDLQDNVNF